MNDGNKTTQAATSFERVSTVFICRNAECCCENEFNVVGMKKAACAYCGEKHSLMVSHEEPATISMREKIDRLKKSRAEFRDAAEKLVIDINRYDEEVKRLQKINDTQAIRNDALRRDCNKARSVARNLAALVTTKPLGVYFERYPWLEDTE